MSIKIDDAVTALERADAIGNLIEQMSLAKLMKDDARFNYALELARTHSFELCRMLEESGEEEINLL